MLFFQIPQGGVEPPDFEDFLYQHQNAIDRDPMRHLLEFPPDDVRVELLQRTVRTVSPVEPEPGYVHSVIGIYASGTLPMFRKYLKTYLFIRHFNEFKLF